MSLGRQSQLDTELVLVDTSVDTKRLCTGAQQVVGGHGGIGRTRNVQRS